MARCCSAGYHLTQMSNLPELRTDSFSLTFPMTGGVLTMKLSGNGDAEAVAPLDRTLTHLHHKLMDDGASTVVVDLCDLYFMNSSCLKAFVAWIYKVRTTLSPYRIRMQLNPRQRWQRRGLEPLQRLAPTVVFLDEMAEKTPDPSAAEGH